MFAKFSKFCFLLERQAQFWKSLVCKGSKIGSIWHPKLSENLPLWSLLPANLPIYLPSNISRHSSHSHFFQTSGIGRPLGYEFRMSAAVPFVHVSFNTLISIIFFIFLCFLQKCACRSGAEHGREGCLYANVWKRLILASKRNRKYAILGDKIRPVPASCCSKNSSFRRLSGKWPSWEAFYMHQTCHWTSFGPNFHFPAIFFHVFYKNVLPAHTGTTILNIDTKIF